MAEKAPSGSSVGGASERQHRLRSMEVTEEVKKSARMDSMMTSITVILIQAAVSVVASNFTYSGEITPTMYGYFRDVNIMIFFGFGFLMTFLHRHGLSAVGFCLVLSCLVVEMSICVEYLLNKGDDKMKHLHIDGEYAVTIESLLNGLFCAGAVMISFGALIGKATPFQLIIMAIIEVFAFWANIRFCLTEQEAHDVGGGMVIHTFGAYFGLAAAWWVNTSAARENPEEKSIYSSDIFSLAGTIFLWVLWPSFQAAVSGDEQRQFLAITNTFLSLCSSTLAFTVFTRLLNGGKFDVVHMQNATLAGGVVMGVAGDMNMGLHGAMLGGFASGLLSCIGYSKLMPALVNVGLHDTCGVNNLHGMPGILGSVLAIIVTAKLSGENDPRDIGGFRKANGDEVTAGTQAIALATSLGMAIGAGTLAGIFMFLASKVGIFMPADELFMDGLFFGVGEDYEDAITKMDTHHTTVTRPSVAPVTSLVENQDSAPITPPAPEAVKEKTPESDEV